MKNKLVEHILTQAKSVTGALEYALKLPFSELKERLLKQVDESIELRDSANKLFQYKKEKGNPSPNY